MTPSEKTSTDADGRAGMAWWNSLPEEARRSWAQRVNTGVAADAWVLHQAEERWARERATDDVDDVAQATDFLNGRCLRCECGPVLVDGDGEAAPRFWAYCDACNGRFFEATSADVVCTAWDAAQAWRS